MTVKIDLKDKKILYELDRDSRQSNKEIDRVLEEFLIEKLPNVVI